LNESKSTASRSSGSFNRLARLLELVGPLFRLGVERAHLRLAQLVTLDVALPFLQLDARVPHVVHPESPPGRRKPSAMIGCAVTPTISMLFGIKRISTSRPMAALVGTHSDSR